jgi:hypothetical protein
MRHPSGNSLTPADISKPSCLRPALVQPKRSRPEPGPQSVSSPSRRITRRNPPPWRPSSVSAPASGAAYTARASAPLPAAHTPHPSRRAAPPAPPRVRPQTKTAAGAGSETSPKPRTATSIARARTPASSSSNPATSAHPPTNFVSNVPVSGRTPRHLAPACRSRATSSVSRARTSSGMAIRGRANASW